MLEAAELPRNIRLKGAVVCEALLRLFRLTTDYFDGDLDAFEVYIAVVCANVGRFTRGPERLQYLGMNYPPQEERRPVSRRAVAASVGLPRETVRRKVGELIEKGHVVQAEGGLVAVAPALERGRHLDIVLGAIRTFERVSAELEQIDSL